MNITKSPLGIYIIRPNIHEDERGIFYESYHKEKYLENGINFDFKQTNISNSTCGVLRGLHYQINSPQAKLITCLKGAICDISVDVNKSSPNYGQYEAYVLYPNDQILLPLGFAHGFVSLDEDTVIMYQCSDYYDKKNERTILYSDPDLNINWPIKNPIVSEKDLKGIKFRDL